MNSLNGAIQMYYYKYVDLFVCVSELIIYSNKLHYNSYIWVCSSVSSIAGEHLSIPGHDYAERSQDDSGGKARGSDSAGGLHQSAHLHHGCQPNISDVGAP